jgi:hypothetical protein
LKVRCEHPFQVGRRQLRGKSDSQIREKAFTIFSFHPMIESEYRSVPFQSFYLGFDTHLVRPADEDKSILVSSALLRILAACNNPEPLHILPDTIMQSVGLAESQYDHVERGIAELIAKGLIVQADKLFPNAGNNFSERRQITSLTFITADRVQDLCRAINSYAKNAQEFGRDVELVVTDDSKSPHARKDCLAALAQIPSAINIRYAGEQEKLAYIPELARLGIDPSVARFALLGEFEGVDCTIGANRNTALLDTIGQCILSIDDDTVCNTVFHPQRDDKLVFRSFDYARDMWFYSSRDKLFSSVDWQSCDLLHEHEQLLGYLASTLVADASPGTIKLQNASPRLLQMLRQHNSRIIATISGVVGDSGFYSGNRLLMSTGATRRRMAESKQMFDTALHSREVLAVAPSLTVTDYPSIMAATLGLVNDGRLPPFLPICRGEDTVFAMLVDLSMRDSLWGHTPVSVLHDPSVGREYALEQSVRVADLMVFLIRVLARAYNTQSSDSHRILQDLGRELKKIASLPDLAFWSYLRAVVANGMSERLRLYFSTIERFPEIPGYWERKILDFHTQSCVHLAQIDSCIPQELKGSYSTSSARESTKLLVKRIGDLLDNWPAIVDACRTLQQREIRISTSLVH